MTDWSKFTPIEDEGEVDWSQFKPVEEPKKGVFDTVRDGAASFVRGAKEKIESAGDAVVDTARAAIGFGPRSERFQPGMLDDPNAMGPQKPKSGVTSSVERLRSQFASVPVENRLRALELMAAADDEQGQAAKALLREVQLENRSANAERVLERPKVAKPAQKLSTNKGDAPPMTVFPEPGELGFGPLDKGLQPVTPESRQAAEAEAMELRSPNRGIDRLVGQYRNKAQVEAENLAKLQAMGLKRADEMYGWAPDQLRDTMLSVTKIAPTLVQLGAELVGARDTREWMLGINAMIDGGKSESERQTAREFQQILADKDASALTVAGFMLANPDFLARMGVETLPSIAPGMLLGRGAAAVKGGVSRLALRGQPLTRGAQAEIAALSQAAAARGAVAGEAIQGAASTYHQLLDGGATPADAARGALVTGMGYAALSKFTGPGLEGMLAKGEKFGRLKAGGVEAVQEFPQAFADEAGMAAGEGRQFDAQKATKEGVVGAGVGFGLGAAMGGEKTKAQQLADALNANIDAAQWLLPADTIARENLRGNAADPSLVSGVPLAAPSPRPTTPRVEQQPTTPLAPEQIAQMAEQRAAAMPPAQSDAPDGEAAPQVQPVDGVQQVGAATVGQGSLAQRAAQVAPAMMPTQLAPDQAPAASPTFKTDAAKLDEIDAYTDADRQADETVVAAFNRSQPPARNSAGVATAPAVKLDAAPSPEMRAVRGIARQVFGMQLVSVEGVKGGDGLAFTLGDKAVAFVRKGAATEELTVAVAGHEATHSLFRERPDLAAKYQEQLRGLLRAGVVENRRQYEGQPDTDAGRAYAEEEVAADVSGSMWLREDFWRKVAELDTDLFRGLRYRFMANMAKLLDAMGAAKVFANKKTKGGKDRFNLERLVTDVAAARDLTAQLWAERASGKGLTKAEQKVEADLTAALARYSKPADAPVTRGVLAEVAPSPDDDEAVKRWRMQDQGEQASTTRIVATRMAKVLSRELGFAITAVPASGYFEGAVNSSFVLSAPDASMEQLQELARLTGFALEQKATIAFDERLQRGEGDTTFAKVILPGQMTTAQVDSLRQHMIERTGLDGDTLRDGAVFYGNFSGKSDEEFEADIKGALASFDSDLSVEVRMARFASDYIGDFGPDSYAKYLEGTRYEIHDQEARQRKGRPLLRRRGGGDPGQYRGADSWVEELRQLRDALVSDARAARQMAAGPGSAASQDARGGAGGAVQVSSSYGEAGRKGAVEVDAFHFSQQKRSVLIAAMHGSGLKGAERVRLVDAPAALKQRIYLYFDIGRGIQPEAGVGGHLHGVRLRNVYDVQADELGLVKQGGGINAFEQRVIDAGFDGYLTRDVYPTPNVVLLGPHSVKVDYLGTSGKFRAANPLPPAARMSRDKEWDDAAFARMDLGDVEKIDMGDIGLEDKVDIQDELDAALGQAPRSRPGLTEMTVPPDKVRGAGLLMEDAFPVLDWQPDGSSMWARASVAGSTYTFKLAPFGFDDDSWSAIPDQPRGEYGEALRLNNVSDQLARSYNQRAAASIALHEDGYDLLSTIDKRQRGRIERLWSVLAQRQDAFEFVLDIPAQQYKPGRFAGAAFVARAQEIADSMLAGSKYQFEVTGAGNLLNLQLRGDPNQEAQIELDDDGRSPRIYLHAIGLNKGSGAGKAFYQVAARIAKDYGAPVVADPQGLTAVNTYRRTEQMLSSALRGRDSSVVQPGYGQRIYGWKPGKAKSIQAENLVRLVLANARNAKEAVPIADQLRYDLATGQFTIGGESAEERVTEALKRRDVRAMSVSRSTLARAALTFEAMEQEVEVPDTLAGPVLYSRDESYTPLERMASDDYKPAEGRELVLRSEDGAALRIDAAALLRDIQKRKEAAQQLLDCLS